MENDRVIDLSYDKDKTDEIALFVKSLQKDINLYSIHRIVRDFIEGFEPERQLQALDDLELELAKYYRAFVEVISDSKVNEQKYALALQAVEEFRSDRKTKNNYTGLYCLCKISKLDFIRIAYVMYDMGFVTTTNGQIPPMKDYMNALGNFYSIDLSKYNASLSQGNNASGDGKRFEIFHKMLERAKTIWEDK